MAISVVTSGYANAAVTVANDLSACDAAVILVTDRVAISGSLADLSSHTLVQRTAYGSGERQLAFWYVTGVSFSAVETFTYTGGTSASVAYLGLSGVLAASAYDTETGADSAGAVGSMQPGAISPATANSIFATGVATAALSGAIDPTTIDSSFTNAQHGAGSANHCGVGIGWKIVTGSENPSWSWTGTVGAAANGIILKPTAAATLRGASVSHRPNFGRRSYFGG